MAPRTIDPADDGREGLRHWLAAIPSPAWQLMLMFAVAAVSHTWWLVVFLPAVALVAFMGHAGVRRRGRRLLADAATRGEGLWLGWVPVAEAEALLGRTLPLWTTFTYSRDGLPVQFSADAAGVTMTPRGWLTTLLLRQQGALIPWADLAGARARHLGYGSLSGQSLHLVPLTAITLDLVGDSADGHFPEPSSEDLVEMLRESGVDPDDPDPDPDQDVEGELSLDADEDTEEEAFWREMYGADWQRGTVPLSFVTSHPEGLVSMVLLRRRGRPASTPVP